MAKAAAPAAPAPMTAVPTAVPAQAAPPQAAPAQTVGSVTRTAQAPALVPAAPPVPQADAPAYETKGRRDPFTTLDVVTGPTGLTVATTKLTGIVRGKSTLALLETSDGIGYILRTGDTLGDGRLVEIGADNVVFAVAAKPGAPPSRVVLKLAAK
jgi:Tfp pilus assembly protein PilP